MEQAFERAKSLKNIKTLKASTSRAQEREEESSKKDDKDQVNKGAIEELRTQISNIQLRQEELYKQSFEWRNEFIENLNSLSTRLDWYIAHSDQQIKYHSDQITQLGEKMDFYHSEIMKYLHGYPPLPPP